MKVVAAALVANVPRKQGIASVVSAYFDGGSDDEETESNSLVPSSAPQKQPEKLTRVVEPSTAPARSIDPPKKIHPPLPLPLLSINPNAGGNETRLSGKDEPASKAPRHWRRHRKQKKNSLLPSRDESEHWESNFPPNLRRFHSPRNYPAGGSDSTTSLVSSSFTSNVRAPLAASGDVAQRTKELLPLIHHTTEGFHNVTVVDSAVDGDEVDTKNLRDVERDVEEEDENWTHCYDDPEAITKSMAGLIQALSTFAADGKKKRPSQVGKSRKRRAKLQRQQQQQHTSAYPPVLRLPQPGEMNVTSGIPSTSTGKQQENSTRKHRKLPNSVAAPT